MERPLSTESERFCVACQTALIANYNKINLDQGRIGREILIDSIHHETLESFHGAVANGCPTCVFAFTRLDKEIFGGNTSESCYQSSSFKIARKIGHQIYTMSFDWLQRPLVPEQREVEHTFNIDFDLCALQKPPLSPPLIAGLNPTCTGSIDLRPWLSHCMKSHSCGKDFRPGYLSPRLLDCRGTKPRLVDGSVVPESSEGRRYAALSHCWGQFPTHLLLTTDNIALLKDGIDLSEVPRTFQDAIKVVQRAGVRYLWIDSLCIIQRGPSHKSDWQLHIKEMADIYSNCYFSIAATHSENSNGGCFVTRPPEFPGISLIKPTMIVTRLLAIVAGDYDNAAKMKLNSRAWTFQERLLSPRIVYFRENDVLWECLESHLSGAFYRERPDRDFRSGQNLLCQVRLGNEEQPPFHWNATNKFDSYSRREQKKINKNFWYSAVEWYSHLAITNPTDRLPGIAAIARRLNESYFNNEAYIAGFFQSDLPRALCFTRLTSRERSEAYLSPTCSWSALQGLIRLDMPDYDLIKVKPIARVKSVSVALVDPTNAYGQLKFASITLKAQLSRMPFDASLWRPDVNWVRAETGTEHLVLNEQGGENFGLLTEDFRLAWDDIRRAKPRELLLLHIFEKSGIILE